MWRQVLHAAICWLAISETFGEANNNVISSIVDNDSAESAPRLYRSVPVGVYASRSPYAAYSFQIPAFISAPKTAASRIVPVKQQIHQFHQNNGYLRDSYGNKFADTPYLASYRTAFPQQYVPLQELPAHLAQPLLAAPQNKQTAPHYFAQYRVPTFQVATSNARPSYSGFPQYSYSQDLRSVGSPTNQQAHGQAVTTNQQQAVSNKLVYANAPAVEQLKEHKNEPKFQRYEYRPEETYRSEQSSLVKEQASGEKGQIEAAAAKTPVTAIVNGKKTVINIETNPVVPLLDLSLLEPLTFDNPLVPQLQHFLPRIPDAKYHSLSEFHDATKKQKKAKATKKKPKQQSHHHKQVPVKPVVIENNTPELVYEINTPNHRETYKEKTISYNKKVEPEPETYSYNEKTEAKPIHYSFQNSEQKEPVSYNVVYSSNKKPEQLTKVSNQGEEEQPRQLIYTFNADEAIEPNNQDDSDGTTSAEDAGSVEATDEDEPTHLEHDNHERKHNEAPRNYQHHSNQHHQDHDVPRNDHRHSNNHHHHNDHHHNERQQDPRHKHEHHNNEHHSRDHQHQNTDRPEHREKDYYHRAEEEHHAPNKQYRSQDAGHHQERDQDYHNKPYHHQDYRHNQNQEYHNEPNQERREKSNQEYNHKPNQERHPASSEEYHHRPKEAIQHDSEHHHSHEDSAPIRVPDVPTEVFSHPQEHEEDIRLLPPQQNAPIKVDPNQHVQRPHQSPSPSPTPEREEEESPPIYNSAPIIQEQGKRIIIQEESPEELHMHQEQIRAEVIDQEDNNEEDFEKAYKNAAYGFPAFEKKLENIEKDIYNPASYGYNRDNEEFSVEKSPFQQYQAEGDSFPRNSRLNYNKAREDTEQGYLLDYSANKPESVADRYRKKADYYKLYEKYKPEKYFSSENKKSEKLRERYTAAPTFDFGRTAKPKSKGYFGQYKAEPIKYEFDYSKGTPRDSSAHASQPYRRLKSKTLFVEPQFQYGFDPISLPQLLDSELAAMASNHNPESEKPGMRKKIYEENWYIKKTSTGAAKPS